MRRLFCDNGEVYDARSAQLRTQLSASLSISDFRRFAVVNLGYIDAAKYGDRGHVQVRPCIVTPATLAGFFYWAGSQQECSWLLSTFEDKWNHRSMYGFDEIRKHLSAAVGARSATRRFRKESIELNDLPPGSPPDVLLSNWVEGAIRNGDIEWVLAKMQGRYVVAELDETDNSVLMLGVGRQMLLARRSAGWCRLASAVSVNDHPDQAYGAWVAQSFRDCARRRAPLVERVEATVVWPAGASAHVYRRVIVPLPMSDSRVLLISSSVIDRSEEVAGATI